MLAREFGPVVAESDVPTIAEGWVDQAYSARGRLLAPPRDDYGTSRLCNRAATVYRGGCRWHRAGAARPRGMPGDGLLS